MKCGGMTLTHGTDKLKFREVVEKVLEQLHVPYNTTFDADPDPDWMRVYDWYEKRYLNPDSPERES